jgi:hypothetical protein
MKNGKWIFVTFAEGESEISAAGERICQQAKQSGLFDLVLNFNDERLREISPLYDSMDFRELRIEKGFGFWVWKPILIQEIMRKYFSLDSEFEGLLYADAGCEIINNNYANLQFCKLFDRLKIQGIGFGLSEHPEYKYTKKIIELDLNLSKDVMSSTQREAGWILIIPNSRVTKLVEDWSYYSIKDGRKYLDEGSHGYDESTAFIASRHDQSLFSALTKKYGFIETPMKVYGRYGSILNASNMIWTARNKTGVSRIPKISNTSFAGLISYILRFFMNAETPQSDS